MTGQDARQSSSQQFLCHRLTINPSRKESGASRSRPRRLLPPVANWTDERKRHSFVSTNFQSETVKTQIKQHHCSADPNGAELSYVVQNIWWGEQ
jgi:hypothetical protein